LTGVSKAPSNGMRQCDARIPKWLDMRVASPSIQLVVGQDSLALPRLFAEAMGQISLEMGFEGGRPKFNS